MPLPKKAGFGAAWEKIIAHDQHTVMLHDNRSRLGNVGGGLMLFHLSIDSSDQVRSQ
jgi:hypothetical protein